MITEHNKNHDGDENSPETTETGGDVNMATGGNSPVEPEDWSRALRGGVHVQDGSAAEDGGGAASGTIPPLRGASEGDRKGGGAGAGAGCVRTFVVPLGFMKRTTVTVAVQDDVSFPTPHEPALWEDVVPSDHDIEWAVASMARQLNHTMNGLSGWERRSA